MTGSLCEFLGLALGDPLCDIALAPYAALRKFGDRLWKALRSRELVRALLRHTEHLADLCRADEFHAHEVTP